MTGCPHCAQPAPGPWRVLGFLVLVLFACLGLIFAVLEGAAFFL